MQKITHNFPRTLPLCFSMSFLFTILDRKWVNSTNTSTLFFNVFSPHNLARKWLNYKKSTGFSSKKNSASFSTGFCLFDSFSTASVWQLLDVLSQRQTCIQNFSTCVQSGNRVYKTSQRVVKTATFWEASDVLAKRISKARQKIIDKHKWKRKY